ncbi:MFS general substrate transporter [Bimuria novae-zelandiae CBS 107.79]|uniref:MFS general substrate transporter n=1 Tax=Bimuria novae-zelandiae CBS 107.79 TaxID=1447943 RepID=A0A6A5UPG6_9PLEO|nr:MFS general substrate transporter [Bimuria novae-zelandiae CBS 107.79]
MATTENGGDAPPAPVEVVSGAQDDMAKRVLRKIDRTNIPLLFVTYMFNFMDKTILSSAAVFGLRDDNNLQGQEYSWVGSIFYFGYLIWEYPTRNCRCSYGGMHELRWIDDSALPPWHGWATITPGFMFLTSTWYTRDEMPVRLGIWFAGNSVGGLCSSLLAFGIGHIKDHVQLWRWMYIILSSATFLWSIPIGIFLPDSISKAGFLTPEERQYAADRVVISGTGSTENVPWKLEQVKECLLDPKTWLILFIELYSQIPNGGTQSFSNIVITSFDFTDLQSTLINIPYSVITASIIAGTGWLAGSYRTLNCLLIIAVVAPPVTGAAIIYNRDHVSKGVQLFAYFLLSSGPAAMPLNMSLVQSNYRGVTKKMTMTTMIFMAYCVGNIAGPHFFRKTEAPKYVTAFQTIMICYALVIVFALTLRFYLQWTNKKQESLEGFEGSAGASGAVADGKIADADGRNVAQTVTEVQLRPEDYDDVTDWKTYGFRYRL